MERFFPFGATHYLAGGLVIGLGVSLLYLSTGLVGGTSTVFTSTWSYLSARPFFRQERFFSSRQWRLVYAAGMILGAAIWLGTSGGARASTSVPGWQLALGGLVAGFGARLSNGCTAGHGICGMASLQPPSMLSVLTFLATAMLAARAIALLGGA